MHYKRKTTSFTTPNWPAETYTWDANGLILTKNYNGYTTEYTYHSGTRLVSKIKQPDGQEAWFDYDALMRTLKAWARPATANSKTTAKVTTEYDYRYRAQPAPTNTQGDNYVKTITTYATAPTGGGTSGLTSEEVFQYLDGLGRPYQTVNRKQSPGQKDVVLATEYDKWGRTIKSYNPIESTLNKGAKLSTIAASTPYTLTEYYADPLSRPWKVTPPSWYATTYTYGANTGSGTTEDRVLLNHTSLSYYAANSLTKSTVKDPDDKIVITFKDKKGRTLLVRRTDTNNTTPANTYNLYDDKDRLTLVIPPGSTYSTSSLNFAYTYDAADLMLTKKVPDAAIVTMRYNNRDQLALEQDGNLTAANKWRCTQYDDFGRVLKTGLFSGSIPATITSTLAPTDLYTENQYGTTGIEKGKIKKSKVKVFDAAGTWLETNFTYDAYGRVSGTTGNNYLLATDLNAETMSYIYDFADNVLKDTRVSKKSASVSSTINQKHNYDHWARNTLNTHQIGTGTEMTVSQLNYDWKNQLIEKNLGKTPTATNYLQSLDFGYNNQGWLTTINNATLGGTNTSIATCPTAPTMPNPGTASTTPDNNDLFYLELKYDALQSGISGTAVKNGNIAQVLWRVRGRERQSYSLTYDYLDRMTGSTYNNLSDAGSTNNAGAWNENLTYDIRGNINTLTRTGKYKSSASPNCWTDGQIDNLAYTYTSNTNKLQKVADTAPTASKTQGWNNATNAASTAQYGYDANGNMTNDPYKGMVVTYNFLNLPTQMQFGNAFTGTKTIDVLYDASGRKLRKTVTDGTTLQYRQDYVGGIEYRSTSTVSLSLESIYHPEGRVFNTNSGTTSADALRYEYSIKDHLGNTRLNFTDKNGDGKVDVTTTTTNEILSESHYYPFGLAMSGPWMDDAAARDNQYKYNGKELNEDFGLGWYDYGARWYDATLGRWNVVDPLAGKTFFSSTYSYVLGNPISLIDPNGMSAKSTGGVDYLPTDRRALPETAAYIISSSTSGGGPGAKLPRFGDNNTDPCNDCLKAGDYIPGLGSVKADVNEIEIVSRRIYNTKKFNYKKSIGYHIFGELGYGATLDESKNPYIWTHKEIDTALEYEMEIAMAAATGPLIELGLVTKLRNVSILGGLGKGTNGTYSVYQGLDAAGTVRYVGITKRFPTARFAEHLNSFGTGKELLRYRTIQGATGLTSLQARIWEQRLINQYGMSKSGGLLLNKINSIAPKYWSIYGL